MPIKKKTDRSWLKLLFQVKYAIMTDGLNVPMEKPLINIQIIRLDCTEKVQNTRKDVKKYESK